MQLPTTRMSIRWSDRRRVVLARGRKRFTWEARVKKHSNERFMWKSRSEGTPLRVSRTDDQDTADLAAAQHPEHPHLTKRRREWRRPLAGRCDETDGTPLNPQQACADDRPRTGKLWSRRRWFQRERWYRTQLVWGPTAQRNS